jgi:hypothetical protein
MLSLLSRQRQLLGARFFERYPSDWLVWEPGSGRPARSMFTSNTEVTCRPSVVEPDRPEGGDAMCFELKQVPGAMLSAGRATENEIVVNDLTVSREQFVLQFDGHQWLVRTKGTPVSVDGVLVAEAGAPVKNGSSITAGDVRLTFYGPDGFPERLEQEVAKHAR